MNVLLLEDNSPILLETDDAADCRVWFTTYGTGVAAGPVAGIAFAWKIVSVPFDGASFNGAWQSGVSVGTGQLNAHFDAPQQAVVLVNRGSGKLLRYTVPSGTTGSLDDLVGVDA